MENISRAPGARRGAGSSGSRLPSKDCVPQGSPVYVAYSSLANKPLLPCNVEGSQAHDEWGSTHMGKGVDGHSIPAQTHLTSGEASLGCIQLSVQLPI